MCEDEHRQRGERHQRRGDDRVARERILYRRPQDDAHLDDAVVENRVGGDERNDRQSTEDEAPDDRLDARAMRERLVRMP